ncbi:MAG: DUF1826 domain-containing protein [Pseudomonadota bacterium]
MLAQDPVRDAAAMAIGIDEVETPQALAAIHRPDCAAVIWRRPVQADFQRWIDSVTPDALPRGRVILRPADAGRAVSDMCAAAGMPQTVHCNDLIDDIASLAEIFAQHMRARWLRLRLAAVHTNACRKFHIDAITARLVCTYRGAGTRYGISSDGAAPQRIFTVPTGAPIMLRGTLWPETPRSGLLHRSPPIEGTGATRCVLVLDPVDDPSHEV